jgi:hypothetical protein
VPLSLRNRGDWSMSFPAPSAASPGSEGGPNPPVLFTSHRAADL